MRTAVVPIVLCVWIALCGAARAEEPPPKFLVDVTVGSLDDARALSEAGFDVAGINRKAMAVGVVANSTDLERLKTFGFPVTVRTTLTGPQAVAALSDYTDPQELSAFVDSVVAAHPTLAKKVVLEATLFEGQQQFAVLITKDVDLPNERPAFMLDAQHHAREVMTPEIAKDMIDYLTSNYETDFEVQQWVDNINIWIVPSVNPDGAMYVFTTDTSWRTNRHPGCGVDNNRNYPTAWGSCNGSTPLCGFETYRGTAPASEPETQGMIQLTTAVRPYFSLSYHSYGEYIMYSYGCADPAERGAFDGLASSLNSVLENDAGQTGLYITGPIWSALYHVDGGSIDDQYNRFGAYGFTIEVNQGGFQPDYSTWRDVTVVRQRAAWGFFLNQTLYGAQIRGTITDATTGSPLPANVSLQEVTFTRGEAQRHADANGHYRLLTRSGMTYHPTYSYSGYCSTTLPVVVGFTPADVNIALVQPAQTPQGVVAAGAGDGAIDVSWQAAVGADQYRVYRSTTAGGPYTLVATVPGSQTSFHDAPVSGGVTYRYVVRSFHTCESANSIEVAASTTGPCLAVPTFAGLTSVSDATATTCTLNLSWPAASIICQGGVTYALYRSVTAPFTPSAANRIASGLSGTAYSDHDALSQGTTYNYIVRAVGAANGLDDGNVVTRQAGPTGPTVIADWRDDAGDVETPKMIPTAPWSVLPAGGAVAPKVYATGTYAASVCAALTSPAVIVQNTSALFFASKYDIETHDAGIVEIATGPTYATWVKFDLNYPDPLAFSGNACGFPTGGAASVFSRLNSPPTYPGSPYAASLASYAGKSIKIRWRLSSDPGAVASGWWVDDIVITNAMFPNSCVPGAAPTPKEPSAALSMTASRAAAGTAIDVVYAPGCGTLDNAIYWGTGPIAGSLAWTNVACAVGNTGHAVFDPGDPAPDTYLYFVIVGQRATAEGSYGTGASGERPEAIGIGACDRPQVLGGTCP